MVIVAVDEGSAIGAMLARKSPAVTCKTSVARVGVLVGVGVSVGVSVVVGVAVKVAVGVGVVVGALVAVFVGRTAIVGSAELTVLLLILSAISAVTMPIKRKARSPKCHFFTQSAPVSALVYRSHSTETGV